MEKIFHQPLGGNEMPRFGGIATMMRLPHLTSAAGLDAAFIGVPLDIGASLRAGTRFGPRGIRAESVMIRPYNMATGAAPFDSLSVADIGDVAINTFNLLDAVRIIEESYDRILEHDVVPLTLGGDHTITRRIYARCIASMARLALCMSMLTPMSTTTCSARKLPTARPSGARWRSAWSIATVWYKSDCARRVIPPTTSTGAAGKAFASCRRRSAGTSHSIRSWPKCAPRWRAGRCT